MNNDVKKSEERVHNMACKHCDSKTVREISDVKAGVRLYQCTKCGTTKVVNTGGYINI